MRFARVFLVMLTTAAVAAEPVGRTFQRDKVDVAVDRAVQFLVSKQDPAEGFIHTSSGTSPNQRTAITSLAVMALAAAGHQVTDATPQGNAMRKALRYVLRPEWQDEDGYFGNADKSQMYGHGITTMMLSEILGQTTDDDMDQAMRRKVVKAVDLILRAQQVPKSEGAEGGWRYHPNDKSADTSVTVWQLMALRAAKNAGIPVPTKAIEDALGYIRRAYAPELLDRSSVPEGKHGFGYTPTSSKYMSSSTTGMGLLSLELCGEHDTPMTRGAAGYLLDNPPTWGNIWLFYGSYYYAQAMYQVGGSTATKGEQTIMNLLLPEQRPDGSWESSSEKERGVGPVFTTSLGILALTVKYHYLPIYQR